MTQIIVTTPSVPAAPTVAACGARTRALLACGAVAGPMFVFVAGLQVLTRDGFDLARHPLSLLSLGEYGWVQIANFVATGVLFIAGAVGMRRAMASGRGAKWGPRLMGFFGACLVLGGVLVADPADGFPIGTPTHAGDPTWHGVVHGMAPALGFLALSVACFVFARRFATRGQRGWAAYSLTTGLALFVPDLFMGRDGFTIALTSAAVVGWIWASGVAAQLRRESAQDRA